MMTIAVKAIPITSLVPVAFTVIPIPIRMHSLLLCVIRPPDCYDAASFFVVRLSCPIEMSYLLQYLADNSPLLMYAVMIGRRLA